MAARPVMQTKVAPEALGKPRMLRRWKMASDGEHKRQRLFDLFTRQPGHQDLTQGMIFYCPLCRRPFGREALAADKLLLTLAHVIPDALGGTWTTLACIKCNNDDGGRKLEADLAASRRMTDWVH